MKKFNINLDSIRRILQLKKEEKSKEIIINFNKNLSNDTNKIRWHRRVYKES